MNVLEAIRRKRAVREYAERPIADEDVHRILAAGRRAQSSKNTQPWHFLAIRDKERLAEVAKMGRYASHVPSAALCVLILTPNPEDYWVMFDAGQSAAYMQLAALELGIGSCMVTFHEPEPAREMLGFPDDLYLRMGVSFGYPARPELLEPASRPGGRRAFGEVIHFEKW